MTDSQVRGLTASQVYTPFGGAARFLRFRVGNPADRRAFAWAVLLTVAVVAVAFELFSAHYQMPPLWAFLVLGGVAATAERQAVFVADRMEISVSFLPMVFTAIVFGPLAAFLVSGLSQAADFRGPRLRWIVYTNVRALSGVLTALAASTIPRPDSLSACVLVSVVASATWIAADAAFGLLTCSVRGGNVLLFAKETAPFFALSMPLCVPLVAVFVFGYHAYSLWVAVGLLVPLLAVQRLIHLYQEERHARSELAAVNARLQSANLSFATALVATLDARDRYTAGHSAAVAIYARDIAGRMGLGPEEIELVHVAGLVHDVGKIGLPAGLLEKPGALTLEERRQMERHSEIGEEILRNVDDYTEIADIVRHHHERIDGLGYPDGLLGDDIPLLSRVIAVADAYNAMTSDRPYREALPSRVARLRLAQAVESQFDTAVVAAFEAILAGADESYRMGKSPAFLLDAHAAEQNARDEGFAEVSALAVLETG